MEVVLLPPASTSGFHGHRKFCIAYFRRFYNRVRFDIRIITDSLIDRLVSVPFYKCCRATACTVENPSPFF